MTEKKYIYNKNYLYSIEKYDNNNRFPYKMGYELMIKALSGEDIPTAFFCRNDAMAVGAYKAVAEKGLKIPEDVSIVGFDDYPSAKYMFPSLTTIKVSTEFIGDATVDLILERIHGNREYVKKVFVPTELKIRKKLYEDLKFSLFQKCWCSYVIQSFCRLAPSHAFIK